MAQSKEALFDASLSFDDQILAPLNEEFSEPTLIYTSKKNNGIIIMECKYIGCDHNIKFDVNARRFVYQTFPNRPEISGQDLYHVVSAHRKGDIEGASIDDANV